MSAYDEQEELEKLKAWWKNYGNSLIAGILLGVGFLVGYRYWIDHAEQQRHIAAVQYDRLFQEISANRTREALGIGETLMKDYASTPYAAMAGLMLARLNYEAGDVAKAREHLKWVLDNADDDAVRHAARLRLARIHLGGDDKQAALALLDVKDRAGFEAEYEELKGDIHAAQGQRDAARAAYREALKRLPEDSAYAPVLNMKLDDLGPEKAS